MKMMLSSNNYKNNRTTKQQTYKFCGYSNKLEQAQYWQLPEGKSGCDIEICHYQVTNKNCNLYNSRIIFIVNAKINEHSTQAILVLVIRDILIV